MNVNILNPFIRAAQETLRAEMQEDPQREDLRLENGAYETDEVTILISLIGTVEGTVFFSMSAQTAIQLASALMGETFSELDRLAQSGVAELGNVIAGRASMGLAQAGLHANISTPSVILGKGASIATLEYTRLVVPLLTSLGRLTIHLALRENSLPR
jgi:chemotaxis protein CheX